MPKTISLLPNSSPTILIPVQTTLGTFQIKWIEDIDSHALFLIHERGESLIATHHNGFSLHVLAEYVKASNYDKARAQLVFISRCGGTVTDASFLDN